MDPEGIGRFKASLQHHESGLRCLLHPTYVRGLQARAATRANENTFPFSANVAGLMGIETVRLLIVRKWWPDTSDKLHYSLIMNRPQLELGECLTSCLVGETSAYVDSYRYPFSVQAMEESSSPSLGTWFDSLRSSIRSTLRMRKWRLGDGKN